MSGRKPEQQRVEPHPDEPLLTVETVPLASIAAGVVVQDHQGRISGFNEAALTLLGLTADELTGLTSLDPRWRAIRADGSSLEGDLHPAMVTLRTGEELDDVVIGVRRADGTLVWMNVSSRRLAQGSSHGVVVTFVEITAQQATEKALELTGSIHRVLLRSGSEEELLEQMCAAAASDVGTLAWVAVAEDDEAKTISVRAAAGLVGYLDEVSVSWSATDERGRGPIGSAIREQRPILVDDLETDIRFAPWRVAARSYGFECALAVPFQLGGRKAAFTIYYPTAKVLDEQSVRVLSGLAADLEYGILNLRRALATAESLESTVRALAAVTELRDPYTFGHQQRVAQLAVAIGRVLGLDERSIEDVRLGATLHDIGKIAVPAELLAKPGGLDQIEFEMVKRHALAGERILLQSQLQSPVPEIAAQHHERLDGSGYPYGLSGNEIHFLAKIVSVADVFEAVVHHRPYRASLGSAAALAILRAGAGHQFDAEIVASCERLIEDGFDFTER